MQIRQKPLTKVRPAQRAMTCAHSFRICIARSGRQPNTAQSVTWRQGSQAHVGDGLQTRWRGWPRACAAAGDRHGAIQRLPTPPCAFRGRKRGFLLHRSGPIHSRPDAGATSAHLARRRRGSAAAYRSAVVACRANRCPVCDGCRSNAILRRCETGTLGCHAAARVSWARTPSNAGAKQLGIDSHRPNGFHCPLPSAQRSGHRSAQTARNPATDMVRRCTLATIARQDLRSCGEDPEHHIPQRGRARAGERGVACAGQLPRRE